MIFAVAACGNKKSVDFTIATDTTFTPFEFTDDKGKFIGIDVDILAAIAENQGFTYKLNSLGFDASMTAVETGEADGMIAGMTINEARKQKYDFSDPYYTSSVTMAVKKDSSIKAYSDLKGKKVVAKQGTSGLEFAEENAKKYGYKVTTVEDSPTMYQMVTNGEVDALFEDTPVIKYQIKIGEVNFKLPAPEEKKCEYGFAVKKGENAELLKKFNDGLKAIKESGKYDEILKSYE